MDNNQRQDWWPNNDKAPETDTSSGAEVHDSVQPHPEPDPVPHQIPEESGTEPETVPQENSYNTWNNPQGQTQDNPYNNWNNQQGQYQNNPYNNWNNQQGQYQNNPYNNWNNQQGQYQNTPYNNTPNRPPMRSNNGMAIASLVMGVLSIALICCGFSYFFGALGILFAILSRKNGPMDPQAKVGLGLSIGGTVVGLLMILFVLFGSTEYSDFRNTNVSITNMKTIMIPMMTRITMIITEKTSISTVLSRISLIRVTGIWKHRTREVPCNFLTTWEYETATGYFARSS